MCSKPNDWEELPLQEMERFVKRPDGSAVQKTYEAVLSGWWLAAGSPRNLADHFYRSLRTSDAANRSYSELCGFSLMVAGARALRGASTESNSVLSKKRTSIGPQIRKIGRNTCAIFRGRV